ncbi:MAG TPA: AAA family ATPase [Casimicrobiaceae bacterium]|nr:AAA family ATPase [Casimicrobiaceae bacterium]
MNLPGGSVTFLFTDIEGSTRLIEDHPVAMKVALERHHALLHEAIVARRGQVFKVVGDAFCAVFTHPADALTAALDAQRALHRERWEEIGAVRVRMGLHTGAAEIHNGEYASSLTLIRVQRVTSAGHGGQTLLSSTTAEHVNAQLPAGTTLRDLGPHKLRGLSEAENIYQLVAADLPAEFPPLRVEAAGASSAAPLQQLVRGRLVGREAESRQLLSHWERAQQARGQLVLLSGEPGVGKTRLAQELIAQAQQVGATVLRGGCYEYEATTPYLPIVEALRDWVHVQSAQALRVTLGATAPEIAKLAPEIETKLGVLAPNAPLSPSEERLRLFDNAARFLQSLAAARGLLLFIDDVHWADQGTLSLLQYLLRHLRSDRVLVLGAYREIELDRAHPLASALVDWNRERLVTRIALGRLSRTDTGALLAAMFGQESISEDFASALFRETEGNPFFIEEVVKSLVEQGQIYREQDRWAQKATHELAIPQSVKEAIGRRLNRLSDGAVDTLRTAAALGKIFPFRELAAVCSATEDQVLDTLDEASAAQLIRARRDGSGAGLQGDDSFAFTHDKIREVLYEELNPIRRRRLHQHIGETLEELYAPASRQNAMSTDDHAPDLAYHFAQAGALDQALKYSLQAAQNAERVFAHDEALEFLEQARESAEALNRTDETVAIDERMGDIHDARGTIQPAVQSYVRALDRATTRERRAELKAKVGDAYSPIGDPRGLESLEQALVELDPSTQTNALAFATALVGRYYHYQTQHNKAIEFLERARRLAEPLDDAPTLCNVYTYLAGAHQHLLQYDESDRWARTSVALGERKNFPLAIALGDEFLAENAAGRGQWNETLAFAEQDHEWAGKIGSLARSAWAGFCRSQGLHGQGKLILCRTAVLEALAVCEHIGEARLATWLQPVAAIVAADLGEHEAARSHAERGWERSQQLNQLLLSAWALNGLGYAAMMRGDLATAIDCYEQYVPLTRETENGVSRNMIIARAAEAFLAAGRLTEAEQLIDRALPLAQFAKAPHYWALARRVQAQLFHSQHKQNEALGAFGEALDTFTHCGSQLELGRALYHRARLELDQGDRDSAHADATSALSLFSEAGAAVDRAATEQLLRV